jgi:hypothetical protein
MRQERTGVPSVARLLASCEGDSLARKTYPSEVLDGALIRKVEENDEKEDRKSSKLASL